MRALSSDTTTNLKISNPNKAFDHLLYLKSGVRRPLTPLRAYFLALEAPVIGLFCNLLFQQAFVGGGFRREPKERLCGGPCFKGFRPRGSLFSFLNGIILPEGKNVALKFVVV